MNVQEAARALGVSPRRVRALIAAGRIPAVRAGREWRVHELEPTRSRRPLSPRSRDILAHALHFRSLRGLTGQDRARTAARIRELRASQHPGRLLVDWWGGRPDGRDAYVSSLIARALAGDEDGVREAVRRRVPEYLARADALADRVATERAVQGMTRERLATVAAVPVTSVADVESSRPGTPPAQIRRILRALGVEPVALPVPTASSPAPEAAR